MVNHLSNLNNPHKDIFDKYVPLSGGGDLFGNYRIKNEDTEFPAVVNGYLQSVEFRAHCFDADSDKNGHYRALILWNENATAVTDPLLGLSYRIYDSGMTSSEQYPILHTGNYHLFPVKGKSLISLNDGVNSRNVMKIYDDGDSYDYGSILTIGGAGNTYIGGGESGHNLYTDYHLKYLEDSSTYPLVANENFAKTGERMYVVSDTDIYFEVNCNTLANRRCMVFNNAGNLILPTSTTAQTTKRVRNIGAQTTDLTAGSSALTTGEIMLIYE